MTPTPSITLLPSEIFTTLDTTGRPLYWQVTDTGLVKLQPTGGKPEDDS